MDERSSGVESFGEPATAAALGREFFEALDARDPHRLRATLADQAVFRVQSHREPISPADEILDYFGSVVSSYPNARWEVTDTVGDGDQAVILFVIREYSERQGRELVSEQVAHVRASGGLIVSFTGYYDSIEFQRQFWEED